MRHLRGSLVVVLAGFLLARFPTAVPAQPAATVEPGYLGVLADDLEDGSAGIRVLDVMAGGPAQAAGLRPGDVITSIDGKTSAGVNDMASLLAGRPAGDAVTFVVRRGNEVVRVEVRLGRRPPPNERRYESFGRVPPPGGTGPATAPPTTTPAAPGAPVRPNPLPAETLPHPGGPSAPPVAAAPNAPPPQPQPPAEGRMLLGVRAVPVSPEIQQALGLPHARGSLVVEVRPGSPAQQAGIPLEAVITEIDGIRADTPQALADVVNAKGFGADVRLSYYRFGQLQQMTIRLGGGTPAGRRPEPGPVPVAPSPLPAAPPTTVPVAPPPPTPVESEADALRRQIRELEARLKALERQQAAEPPKNSS